MGAPHTTSLRVRFYELDPYGHVNHSIYVQYFESARVRLLSDIGFGLDRLQQDGFLIVVSRINTRFLASAVLDDELVVETELATTRRVSATWAQRIRRGEELIATQDVEVGCTTPDGKITRWPEPLVTALSPYTS